jgi:formylmethanofuran dehydrogenase subunit E
VRHTITVHDRLKEHQCAICGKQFALSLQMRRHVKVVHEGLKGKNLTKYLKKCDHCDEKYNKPDMRKHLKTVHNIEMVYWKKNNPVEKIKCELCEEVLFKSDMNRHRRIVHGITTDYKNQHLLRAPVATRTCKYCEKEFFNWQSVEQHIKSVHKKIKDQKCNQCDKAFSSQEILRRHIRNVHEGSGKISCDFCGNTYNNKTTLKHKVT